MQEQNRIFSTLSGPHAIARVQKLLAAAGPASRTEVGRRVCRLFAFHNARGQLQIAGCMQALRSLEARGRIRLPAPRHERRRCRPRCLSGPLPAPENVPAQAGQVRGLALVEVTNDDQRQLWNQLLQQEHPRGAVLHVGAQLRYLLLSDHGVLGALGFAASALALAARDAFIGWDEELRSRRLHRVVALSRFLIRPSVCCHNLASKALGLALRRLPELGPGAGLAQGEWARHEFGGAPLGDVRLSQRLVHSAEILGRQPMASFPGASGGKRAEMKGYYRMIDQPDDSQVTPANILAPHRQRTLQRMQGQATVLCIQDGTDLNFAEHGGCQGLGYSGKNQRAEGTLGLHMHSTLAVNGEGIPLGVPQIQFEAPDGQAERGKPLEQRKTYRWIKGLQACAELAAELDGVRPVAVLDREADVHALFTEQKRLGTVDLLVRAQHNRSQGQDVPKLFDGVRGEPAQARMEIQVARLSARRASRKQKARAARAGRVAPVELRWKGVQLRDPDGGGKRLGLQLVHVREEPEPEGAERLEWFLLTTLAVESRQDAERILEWYRLRWRIEDWHRVLKTGCKAEWLGSSGRRRRSGRWPTCTGAAGCGGCTCGGTKTSGSVC